MIACWIVKNTARHWRGFMKSLIQEIHQKLQDGMPFIKAEQIYSDLDSARDESPPQKYLLKDLNPIIVKNLEQLEKGQFTKPIKTTLGFHIFS